jgi:hypothetical protein
MFSRRHAMGRLFPFVSGLAVFLLFFAARPVLAQSSTGTILGVVKASRLSSLADRPSQRPASMLLMELP